MTAGQADTLESAWKEALAKDHRIAASEHSGESAEATLSAARRTRLPRLTALGGYTWLADQPAFQFSFPGIPLLPPVEASFLNKDFLAVQGALSVPVFTSGKISHGIAAAENGYDASRLEHQQVQQDVKMEVADAYVNILRARKAVSVAESHVESLHSHSAQVARMYDHDLVSKADLLSAQTASADAEQKALQASNALDLATASYNRLLGRPLGRPVELAEMELSAVVKDSLDTLTERALQARVEIEATQMQENSLRNQAASVRGEAWPQVALTGSVTYIDDSYLTRNTFVAATVGVSWDVFDFGQTLKRAAAVDEKASAAAERREELRSLIELQVRKSYLDADEARRRLQVTRQAVAQADENLKETKSRYAANLATNTEVLDAESLRVLTLGNYNNAVYDSVIGGIRLRRAIGAL
ncbi:MAG: TolC family protein [Oligoflexia bacterium]|nr:TolC family protein [Oligoflexia bacterium]